MIKSQYSSIFHSGKDLFDANFLRINESNKVFNLFMGELKELIVKTKPTATHSFIKKLVDMKKLKRVYIQNIDNLEELVGLHIDLQFEKVKNNKAQVVQLHATLEKLQCKVCTNIYEFMLQYCKIFKQNKVPKCTRYEEKENVQIEQGNCPHTIGQLNPTIILYSDSHLKRLEINQIAAQDQHKADCLIIIRPFLRIPG
ncbi:9424_t:CDS:2, partial [Cetraspora pellucida]